MNYIIFYNYENGEREFGFYEDYDEASVAYIRAIKDANKYNSRVEIGIAEITDSHKTYIQDLCDK